MTKSYVTSELRPNVIYDATGGRK